PDPGAASTVTLYAALDREVQPRSVPGIETLDVPIAAADADHRHAVRSHGTLRRRRAHDGAEVGEAGGPVDAVADRPHAVRQAKPQLDAEASAKPARVDAH